MIVANEKELIATPIDNPEVRAAAIKVLVGPQQGWSDYVMRVIELDADGYSPSHTHPWPHINYMLEGQGTLTIEGKIHAVQAGGYAYVPAGSHHQFKNTGSGKFRFICIVPKEGHPPMTEVKQKSNPEEKTPNPSKPMDQCTLSSTPEHARADDTGEPCDDGRAG